LLARWCGHELVPVRLEQVRHALVRAGSGQLSAHADRDAVHERVEPAELGRGRRHGAVDVRLSPRVHAEADAPRERVAQGRRGLLVRQVRERDARAVGGEGLAHRAAERARAAEDEDALH
jgi:hypothetical protein